MFSCELLSPLQKQSSRDRGSWKCRLRRLDFSFHALTWPTNQKIRQDGQDMGRGTHFCSKSTCPTYGCDVLHDTSIKKCLYFNIPELACLTTYTSLNFSENTMNKKNSNFYVCMWDLQVDESIKICV